MKTRIVSAFPATGKTYLSGKGYEGLVISDSDSSSFSWLYDSNGQQTSVRNPRFPANYIEHIKSLIGAVDIIFVSSHFDVQNALSESGLCWSIVIPDRSLRDEWIGRCYVRGNTESFIRAMINNWDNWTYLDLNLNVNAKCILSSGEFIEDRMYFLETIAAN
jgi:hypothetical protein